jgi:hypothetical protein
MGAAASVQIMMMFAILGGGGSPSEEPGTLRLLRRASAGLGHKRVSCRTEMVASPRRIRKAHRAPSTRGAFSFYPFFT